MNSLLDSLEILLCKSVILIDKPGYVWNEMNGASVEECCWVCIIALLKCLLLCGYGSSPTELMPAAIVQNTTWICTRVHIGLPRKVKHNVSCFNNNDDTTFKQESWNHYIRAQLNLAR